MKNLPTRPKDRLDRPAPSEEEIRDNLINLARRAIFYRPMEPILDPREAEKMEGVSSKADILAQIIRSAQRETALRVARDEDEETAEDGIDHIAAAEGLNDKIAATIANSGASHPSYDEALKLVRHFLTMVGADDEPELRLPTDQELRTEPWQITGAVWMCMQLLSLKMGAILADELGLGKTITSLITMLLYNAVVEACIKAAAETDDDAVQRLPESNLPAEIKKREVKFHRPTLVLVPMAALQSYIKDTKKVPGAKVAIFYGEESDYKPSERDHFVGTSIQSFVAFVTGLDPLAVATANTIILTTYGTLRDVQQGRSADQGSFHHTGVAQWAYL